MDCQRACQTEIGGCEAALGNGGGGGCRSFGSDFQTAGLYCSCAVVYVGFVAVVCNIDIQTETDGGGGVLDGSLRQILIGSGLPAKDSLLVDILAYGNGEGAGIGECLLVPNYILYIYGSGAAEAETVLEHIFLLCAALDIGHIDDQRQGLPYSHGVLLRSSACIRWSTAGNIRSAVVVIVDCRDLAACGIGAVNLSLA